MQFSKDNIISVLKGACDLVISRDSALFEINISERALTHRLWVYLEQLLPEEYKNNYFIDCEYNRDGFAEKAIRYEDKDEDSSVYPDIIIHQRCSTGNLLIIEAKKDAIKTDFKNDKKKLKQYCKEYHYQYAFFINFSTSERKIEIHLLNQESWKLEMQQNIL